MTVRFKDRKFAEDNVPLVPREVTGNGLNEECVKL